MKIIQLFTEIKNGDESSVGEIVAKDTNLFNQYLYGVTPLLYSIECGREDIALWLCSNSSVDVSLCDNTKVTPLERAIETKCYRIVEEILKRSKKRELDEIVVDDETLLTKTLKSDDQNISIALINGKILS